MPDRLLAEPLHPTSSTRRLLPIGNTLPTEEWARRHRVLCRLLISQTVMITIVGLAVGRSVVHIGASAVVLAAVAAFALWSKSSRRLRMTAITLGLLSCSAQLVDALGGVPEAHFHFFVMVAALSLYEDWVPFTLAIAYVAMHYWLLGTFLPDLLWDASNHQTHPAAWAALHAGFIALAALAQVSAWRLNEDLRERNRDLLGRVARDEVLYRSLVRNLPDTTVLILDRDLRFRLVDGALVASGRLQPERLVRERGPVIHDLLSGLPGGADLMRSVRQALEGQITSLEVNDWEEASSSVFEVLVVPLRDTGTADVIGVLLRVVNITVKRRLEGRVRHERAFLEAVLESLNDGVMACDAEGNITLRNRTMRDWNTHETLVSVLNTEDYENATHLHHPDGRRMTADEVPLVRGMSGETVVGQEVLLRGEGLADRIIISNALPLHDHDGNQIGAVATAHDITERRRLEEQLRAERSFLSAVLEQLHDGVIACDQDGNTTVYNRALRELDGSDTPIIDAHGVHKPGMLLTPDGQPLSRENHPLSRAFNGEVVRDQEIIHVRHQRVTLQNGVPLTDSQGSRIGAMVTVHDITEQRRAEIAERQRAAEEAAREAAETQAQRIEQILEVTDVALKHSSVEAMARGFLHRLRDTLRAPFTGVLLDAAPGERSRLYRLGEAGELREDAVAITSTDTPETVMARVVAGSVASHLILPLHLGEDSIGAVCIGDTDGAREFSVHDRHLLTLAAHRIALGVSQAQTQERQRQAAANLQRSMLPSALVDEPGVTVAARYLPAEAAELVGGDWYDAIPLGDGRVGVVMGDVVGSGLQAAALMGRTLATLRAYAVQSDSPAEVICRMNATMFRLERGEMTTVAYVIVDPIRMVLCGASAAHPAPLLRRGSRVIACQARPSLPLGSAPNLCVEEWEQALEPGDLLVLYTDGLVEHRGQQIEDGVAALSRALVESPAAPEEVCDTILQQLLHGDRSDDVSLLALALAPLHAPTLELRVPAEPESGARVRSALRQWLPAMGATESESAEITVAVGEALLNAVEHAYGLETHDVLVQGHADAGQVQITIRDFGRWRAPRGKERGQGTANMRALMDRVVRRRTENGTIVELRRALSCQPAAGEEKEGR